MRLFVYGTLLDPLQLRRFAGRSLAMRDAALRGWRRARLHGTPFPTLRRARAVVPGALIDVDAATLRRLDAYEGKRYRRLTVTARTNGRSCLAMAWVGPA